MNSHMTCGVLFEGDPVWLWSLRPNSWLKIFFTGPDEAVIRQDHPALFAKLEDKIAIIPTTFAGDYPTVSPDYMWVSGSKCFLELLVLPPIGRHAYCLLRAPRRVPSDLCHIQWTKINHRCVGGVTNARGSFGIDDRSPPIKVQDDLSRTLGHVIKYSTRPKVCDPDPGVDHYKRSDLLSLSWPRKPILFPTYMSRTGWGIRPLSDKELASCFDLPDYLPWTDRYLTDIVALQMCRSVIDCVIGENDQEPPRQKAKVEGKTDDSFISSAQDVVWLPLINRWLPGSWADADIADKAVKSDNAPVDFKPWQRRIQLVLPCPTTNLGFIERIAMRKWRSNICRSLFRYLKATYGDRWQVEALSPIKRKLSNLPQSHKKRRRLSSDDTDLKCSGGGWMSLHTWILPIFYWT